MLDAIAKCMYENFTKNPRRYFSKNAIRTCCWVHWKHCVYLDKKKKKLAFTTNVIVDSSLETEREKCISSKRKMAEISESVIFDLDLDSRFESWSSEFSLVDTSNTFARANQEAMRTAARARLHRERKRWMHPRFLHLRNRFLEPRFARRNRR